MKNLEETLLKGYEDNQTEKDLQKLVKTLWK